MNMNEWSKYITEWRERKRFFTPDSMSSDCGHERVLKVPKGEWCEDCGSHNDGTTDWKKPRNPSSHAEALIGKLMLVVSEIAESVEAVRHQYEENFREEIADTFIRLFDICGAMEIDIEDEINRKMRTNEGRPDRHGKRVEI